MQGFSWYVPNDGSLWRSIADQAQHLSDLGVSAVWLPPAYKGQAGIDDVGYGVYDLWDLGEFDQKGAVRTKYGTREEYVGTIQALHDYGIHV
nr:alpha-amylase family glycosyl hydrolase [Streptococcus anginosus]